MDYISYIRKYVGHKPIMATSVTGIILDNENVLFEKRADNGMWCIPGGSIEFGESLEEALKREVKEETSLSIFNPELFNIESNVHVIYPNGDEVYYTDVVFVVKDFVGELTPDNESTDLRWFPITNLPENIVPMQKIYLEKYAEEQLNQKVKKK